jgi:hypothetical protein
MPCGSKPTARSSSGDKTSDPDPMTSNAKNVTGRSAILA